MFPPSRQLTNSVFVVDVPQLAVVLSPVAHHDQQGALGAIPHKVDLAGSFLNHEESLHTLRGGEEVEACEVYWHR